MTEQAMPSEHYELVVEVGHEELEHGRVRAELHDDGHLLVEKRFEGKAEQFERRLEKTEAEETMRSADDLARMAPRDARDYRPVPDEARYEIAIRRRGEEPVTLRLWQNELEENDAARRLIAALAQQVERASDGQAVL